MTITNIRYADWLARQMKNSEFREAVEDQEVAFQIGRLRMMKGITQAQLAEMVGTKQSSIARLESGKTMPRLSFLRKVVNALGGHMDLNIRSEDELERELRYPKADPVSPSERILVMVGTDPENLYISSKASAKLSISEASSYYSESASS
jgi:transcriptional regulator with XRE-family HTH domain